MANEKKNNKNSSKSNPKNVWKYNWRIPNESKYTKTSRKWTQQNQTMHKHESTIQSFEWFLSNSFTQKHTTAAQYIC